MHIVLCSLLSDELASPFWLNFDDSIEDKNAVSVADSCTGFGSLLIYVACGICVSVGNYHTSTHSLHSANISLLSVPCVRTIFASRGFSIAAPTVWNSLPYSICSSTSADTFRRLLKTHCFQQAYCSP